MNTTLNFNNLPSEILSMIYKMNKDKEQDEHYRQNYHNFVNNFKESIVLDNDITYDWLNRLECPMFYKDITDINDSKYPLGASLKQIKRFIDYGVV